MPQVEFAKAAEDDVVIHSTNLTSLKTAFDSHFPDATREAVIRAGGGLAVYHEPLPNTTSTCLEL